MYRYVSLEITSKLLILQLYSKTRTIENEIHNQHALLSKRSTTRFKRDDNIYYVFHFRSSVTLNIIVSHRWIYHTYNLQPMKCYLENGRSSLHFSLIKSIVQSLLQTAFTCKYPVYRMYLFGKSYSNKILSWLELSCYLNIRSFIFYNMFKYIICSV